jgi:hypothetical protein
MNVTNRPEIERIQGFFVKTVTRFGTSAKVKNEFSSMYQSKEKVMLYEFSTYRESKRITDSFHVAFLKQFSTIDRKNITTGALPQMHLTSISIISLQNTSFDGTLKPCSGFRTSAG